MYGRYVCCQACVRMHMHFCLHEYGHACGGKYFLFGLHACVMLVWQCACFFACLWEFMCEDAHSLVFSGMGKPRVEIPQSSSPVLKHVFNETYSYLVCQYCKPGCLGASPSLPSKAEITERPSHLPGF